MARVKASALPLLSAIDSSAVVIVSQGGDSYRYPLSSLLGQISDDAVITAKIAAGAVTESKIADNSVSVQKLVDGSVTNAKLAEGSVTLSKLGDLQVSTVKIADSAVSAIKLSSIVQAGTHQYAVATGPANAYVVANTVPHGALLDGMLQAFKVPVTNTGAATLNVDGLGVKSIVKNGSTPLVASDLLIGQIVTCRYDGINWQKQ